MKHISIEDLKDFEVWKSWRNGGLELEPQQERAYSKEDMSEAHFQGWVTRERFDDQVPDIIYPAGLDYEEKREYAFNLWFENFKKK